MSVRIGNKIVAGMPEKALHGIGEIFTTTDTGVIAGAVEANGGSYNLADYNSGTDSIASKLTAGSIAYVSKAEFQTQVTNTGACDSFGWDGTADPTFLVPKLNPWHVGKNAPVVGNGMTLGLTDGTNTGGLVRNVGEGWTTGRRSVYGQSAGTVAVGTDNLDNSIGVTTDPTKSGMIADLSETTNLRVMVQLATGATDQALETCTGVLSDVSALNAHRVIEFQAPTAENGYTWYRKYADGWVEQGGRSGGKDVTITMPVEMSDNHYVVLTDVVGNIGYGALNWQISPITTTGFKCFYDGDSSDPTEFSWQVSGISA